MPDQWSQSHCKAPGSSTNIQHVHLGAHYCLQSEKERIAVHSIFRRAIEATCASIPEICTATTQACIGSVHLLRTYRQQFPPTFKCALHKNYPSVVAVSDACS